MTNDLASLVSQYGLAIVFTNVLVEQIGMPVPAIPTLMVAAALAVNGKLSLVAVFAVALLACAIADIAWYVAGRRYGNRVMRFLCGISLTPDSCVSEAQTRFESWGRNVLLVAKFLPGVALLAPPLAGATRSTSRAMLSSRTMKSLGPRSGTGAPDGSTTLTYIDF